ncbi:MAG: serine protease [Caldilinea sp. CFX5]|nr:serine protease [Caldilinea sp. CFX5]
MTLVKQPQYPKLPYEFSWHVRQKNLFITFPKHIKQAFIVFLLAFLGALLGVMSKQNAVQGADPVLFTPLPDLSRTIDIVGGQPADPGEWPWQAFVRAGPYMCGGSLIHEQWVVTAAHCVVNKQNVVLAPADITVTLGEHDRTKVEGTEQKIGVMRVIPHPAYQAPWNDNDIALLQLATPAVLGPAVATVEPLVSPTFDAFVAPGAQSFVTGWGVTVEGGSVATELQEVMAPIVSNEKCQAVYGQITMTMLCAGYDEGGKDSCQGDSGGPLVVQADDNRWKLAGIVSFGYGCARPGFYGVYTRVSGYVSWLTEQINGQPATVTTPTPTPTPLPPIHTMLLPDQAATITMTGTNATKTIVEIPAGAVTMPTELIYSESYLPTQPAGVIRVGGRTFSLHAQQDNLPITALTFQLPVTMTILYADAEMAALSEAEMTLVALQPADGSWSANTVVRIQHDPEINRLVVAITVAADYAFGAPNRMLFLPMVLR